MQMCSARESLYLSPSLALRVFSELEAPGGTSGDRVYEAKESEQVDSCVLPLRPSRMKVRV